MKILAKTRLFRRFDPRLAAELKHQRRSIVTGLICVAISNLFDLLTLPLISLSITLIIAAAPLTAHRDQQAKQFVEKLYEQAPKISEAASIDEKSVREALKRIAPELQSAETEADTDREATLLARDLRQDKQTIARALAVDQGKPRGDIDAVTKLAGVCGLVILAYACRYWFIRGQMFYLTRATARLTSDLREKLFAKLMKLPISYFGEKRAGAIQSVLTNDVNVYQNAIGVVRDSIEAPIRIVACLGFVIWTEWRLALVTVLFLPPMALIINRNSRKMKKAQASVQDDLAELSAVTTESIQGTRVIKAFSAEDAMVKAYTKNVESSYLSQIGAAKIVASLRPTVEFTGACSLAAVMFVCGLLSYRGELSLGNVAALLFALDRVNQSLRSIGSITNTYNMVEAASDRIHSEVLDVPDQVIDENSGHVLENPKGRIEFRNVTFRYPDGTEALKDVSFTLEPGRSLALVGPSGAGKSTIADLLLRFYDPSDGQILFDGVDLRDLQISWLRRQIGVVPQHTFLFAGSVAENIRLGKEDATLVEIEDAAKAAYADEFVEAMDHKYDSQLGESGTGLSGGQRQRIAIARALVRQPSLLLLDEATSALDATSEKAVTEALDVIMKERTTLFIAHRLTTAARADRILVLSKGQAIESGTHAELMENGGAYAGLFRAFGGGLLE